MPAPTPPSPVAVRRALVGALLGLPFLGLLGAVWLGLIPLPAAGIRQAPLADQISNGVVLLGVLAALGWSIAAHSAPVRVIGYAVYAMALAMGFGVGGVFAFLNAVGGIQAGTPGPGWVTVVLAVGSVSSALCLFAVVVLVLAEIGSSR